MTLAILGSAGLLALLIVAVAALGRRFFWVRQLAFHLCVGAGVAALQVFRLLAPAWQPAALADALAWAALFLGLITGLPLLGISLFGVHLTARRVMRLPPLLPAVPMLL